MKSWCIFLFVCTLLLQQACLKQYDGYIVLRVFQGTEQLDGLIDEIVDTYELNVWKELDNTNLFTDLMVKPGHINDVFKLLDLKNIQYTVLIDNVQRVIDQTMVTDNQEGNIDKYDLDTTRYHNLTEIYNWLDEIVTSCEMENDSCHVMQYGESFEGIPLKTVHIGRQEENRRYLWLDCGIHAREWIAPAVCDYIIERLILDVNEDEEVAELRKLFDWFVTPVVNPDGYEYTWTSDRMWRKTRVPNEGSECMGIDGNRNYPYQWGGDGASDQPCSETYRGTEALSAVEVEAVNSFVNGSSWRNDMDMIMAFHSYGKILIYPWAYTDEEDPDNIDDITAGASVMVDAINNVHDQGYVHGHPGIHSGSSIDWGRGTVDVPYSYLLELRDDGEFGFLLPPDQIQPCVEEVWEGVKAIAFHIASSAK